MAFTFSPCLCLRHASCAGSPPHSIEVISYFVRPVSLSVRLFANMMAGHTMMKVFAGFTAALGVLGIAPILLLVALTGFEIMVAVLQAYVFTVLTCLYLNDAIHLH